MLAVFTEQFASGTDDGQIADDPFNGSPGSLVAPITNEPLPSNSTDIVQPLVAGVCPTKRGGG